MNYDYDFFYKNVVNFLLVWLCMLDIVKWCKIFKVILVCIFCLLSFINNGKLYSFDKDLVIIVVVFVVCESY